VQSGGGQRGRQGQLDQGESPWRDAGAADGGAGPVDEQQVVPRHGQAHGADREGVFGRRDERAGRVEVALAGKQRVCFHAARSWSAKPRNPVVCPCVVEHQHLSHG
jgi:hypothetical protein